MKRESSLAQKHLFHDHLSDTSERVGVAEVKQQTGDNMDLSLPTI